ncbi:MAG: uracil phosphoribosyltransferase [bacterium]|nr:uracil phosphoribosyltransferase [bacterium]
MKNVFVSSHPLVADLLTILRDKQTGIREFRSTAEQISSLLITDASGDLSLSTKAIETPLTKMHAPVLSENIVLFTILRAGLAMLHPAMKLFPSAEVGFAGLRRNEQTAIAEEYYWKMPTITKNSLVFLLDPMLATGGSALCVLRKIKQAKEIRLVTIISAPEGITAIHSAFPNVRIYTGAVDQKLNARKYIVPGLGDFGDLYFGT